MYQAYFFPFFPKKKNTPDRRLITGKLKPFSSPEAALLLVSTKRSVASGDENELKPERTTKNDQNVKIVSITKVCHMGCRLFCHMEDQ